MRPLIWKEFRENLKWAVLPVLVILGPTVLFGGIEEPPSGMELVPFHIMAGVFGAVLGFLQVFPESRGDKRSLLLHRPISHSQVFLGKVSAGVALYLLAIGVPFAAVVVWCATPGHVHAPFTAGMLLPWVADLFTGLVYYFAGMLTAQREARWYGSRGLGLAVAVLCTFLVWVLPEFWQAMLTIGVLATVVGVAAWGSFLTGGAYAPQPRVAKVALAATLLIGLIFLGVVAKYNIGGWFEPEVTWSHTLDRKGRVLQFAWKQAAGPVGTPTDLDGRVPPDFEGKRIDRNLLEEIGAPLAAMDWPMFRSYRGKPRYSVEFFSESQPGNEHWYYVPSEGRLLGYDEDYKAYLGSFGPEGFAPAGEPATDRFEGKLCYTGRHWDGTVGEYLAFPGGVYTVDFSRRKIRKFFTPPAGETVTWARQWRDRRDQQSLLVVSTDQSVHVLKESGAPVVSVPRAYDRQKYGLRSVGRLENPERYVFWYTGSWYLDPEEFASVPGQLLEYDAKGHKIAHRELPRGPSEAPTAQVLIGLATPMTEAALLTGVTRSLRSGERLNHGMEASILLNFLEHWTWYFIPGLARASAPQRPLVPGFIALTLVSATACALVCFLLARRYAFSRARRVGWALCGFLFGPAGLLLMLCLQEWPARVACPSCRKARVVTRDTCEHCGALHAAPAPDGTEVFEEPAEAPPAPAAVSVT